MIIPALDLIDGQVVRLYQGKYEQQTQYEIDIIEQLLNYYDAGAKWLHLVDLTGAKQTNQRQTPLINEILAKVPAQIQVGGGIRCEQDIQALFSAGASRVVIGSAAVKNIKMVQAWFHQYGAERFVLALDVKVNQDGQAHIAVSGWQENSGILIDDMITTYLPYGLKHVLCTDIAKDGTLKGSNTHLYQTLCQAYPQVQFQSSGGIGALDDILALKQTDVSSVIVGRALLEEKFTIKEAIACWQNGSSHA